MAGPREQQLWLPWGRHGEVPGKKGFHERGQQAARHECAELGPPIPGAVGGSWDRTWEGEAERWFTAIDGESCVQPSVLAKRGVGAGGSAAGGQWAHSCQQGRKSRDISACREGRGSTFFDVANVS